jgi:GAF domain-containing protein
MTVLCVDPDDRSLQKTAAALSDAGFDVRRAGSATAARQVLEEATVECLVTEHDLGDETGMELVKDAREHHPDLAAVLCTDVSIDELDDGFGGTVVEYQDKRVEGALENLARLVGNSVGVGTQTAYPLPENEEARLASLEQYGVDPEGVSDSLHRLTEIAARTFDVDAAVVGFVDAHQEHFVSCYGKEMNDLDRENTVCTYAILDDSVTVIEDVRSDPRFEANDVLLGTNIRFYAGAPIITGEGHAIGTFCLDDDQPGTMSKDDRELLQLFAAEVMDRLELHRRFEGER